MTGRTYARHRHQEFLKFLKVIDERYPGVDIHLVLDNYRTRKPRRHGVAGRAPPRARRRS